MDWHTDTELIHQSLTCTYRSATSPSTVIHRKGENTTNLISVMLLFHEHPLRLMSSLFTLVQSGTLNEWIALVNVLAYDHGFTTIPSSTVAFPRIYGCILGFSRSYTATLIHLGRLIDRCICVSGLRISLNLSICTIVFLQNVATIKSCTFFPDNTSWRFKKYL